MIGFGSWYVVHGLSYLCWESIGLIRLCKLIEMSTVHGSRFTLPAPQSCNQTIHASIQQHQDLRLYSGVVSGSLAPSVNWQQWVMHRLGLRDQDMAEPSKDYSLRSWLLRKRTWTSSKCHQVLRYVSSSLQVLRDSTVLDVSYLSFLLAHSQWFSKTTSGQVQDCPFRHVLPRQDTDHQAVCQCQCMILR